MAMLKRKVMIKTLLCELPKLAILINKDRKNNKSERLMYETQRLYKKIILYNNIIDNISMGRLI